MKWVRRLWGYFFRHDDHDLSLLMLAVAAATSGSGIVAAALWISHSPPALPTVNSADQTCLKSCSKVCGKYIR
jgi:hypothetical protein